MMHRLPRIPRQPDQWSSQHERARIRAAQRLDEGLDPDEAAWLDRHLGDCAACRSVAAAYERDRQVLRGLRDEVPTPPRDLWARTSAALEREAAARRRRRIVRRDLPLGALSGVAVMAVVVGVSLLSNLPVSTRPVPAPATDAPVATAPEPVAPAATPLTVASGDVQFLRLAGGTSYDLTIAAVDRVCPAGGKPDCPELDSTPAAAVSFEEIPQTIIGSPDDAQAVVVAARDDEDSNEVLVVPLPTPRDKAAPESPAPQPNEAPGGTPAPSAGVTPAPTPSVAPTPTEGAAAPPSPTVAPTPAATPAPQATDGVGGPTDQPDPEPAVGPEASPSAGPGGPEASPTPEQAVAIASGVRVVGETAAYSADGTWFAFTATPADGSAGPDIYVWRVGEERARQVTTDHRSVFASWYGNRLIGSRPLVEAPDGGPVAPATFVLDPETGEETRIEGAGWLPAVDPFGRSAVSWVGTVAQAADGEGYVPAEGRLELRRWPWVADDAPEPVVLAEGTAADIDVRWDESGEAFAVWLQDPVDPSIGRLSLYFVDPETGAVSQPDSAPRGVPALAGFSIGQSRLAWASPPGQGGEGSRVLIVAWTEDGVGTVESAPGEDVVVVR